MKKKRYFIVLFIISIICLAGLSITAYATDNRSVSELYAESPVLEDLLSSTIKDKAFDLEDYPYDNSKDIELISFIEYAYSFDTENQQDYGLYVYLYNPKGKDIDVSSGLNKIQMATSYTGGEPVGYSKLELKFLNASTGDYKNLFYKFKVDDNNGFLNIVNSNARRYDISGIELLTKGASNATEYKVEGKYIYSGYVGGYGPDKDAESTLTYEIKELKTITLDVKNTRFRTGISSAGAGHQNDLHSVYFSIPNDILDSYGVLQKIKAEWYEYKTSPIIVTDSTDVYNNLHPLIGNKYTSFSSDRYSLYGNYNAEPFAVAEWGFNAKSNVFVSNEANYLSYLFKVNDSKDFVITSNQLKEYIESYSKSYINGKIQPQNLSADLFSSGIDSGRKRGYNNVVFDAQDEFDLLSYDSNHSGWDRFLDAYWWKPPETSGDYLNISPIYAVRASDIDSNNTVTSTNLLIAESDVADFKQYYNNSKLKNESTYLFRFANTDYYSRKISVFKNDFLNLPDRNSTDYAEATCFLDFDIIELTFNRDDFYTVMPVVMSPMSIYSDITPPLEGDILDNILGLFKNNGHIFHWFLMVLFLILGLVFLLPVLPYLIKLVVFIITLPFKLLGAIFKGIGKALGAGSRRYVKHKD